MIGRKALAWAKHLTQARTQPGKGILDLATGQKGGPKLPEDSSPESGIFPSQRRLGGLTCPEMVRGPPAYLVDEETVANH